MKKCNGYRTFRTYFLVFTLFTGLLLPAAKMDVSAASLRITNKNSVKTLWSGQSKTLKVSKSNVSYQTSNSDVVSVTKSGKITGEHAGTATITVSLKSNKEVKASVKVKVKYGGITSLSYNREEFTWYRCDSDDDYWQIDEETEGGDTPFMVYSDPYLIYADACKWSSSNEDVATIGEDGTVYFEDYGETTLTCKYGGKTATMYLTIEEYDEDEDDDDWDDWY
ncbi:MAG: Ig-like domain-containing protein [Lachnospiraceae bacterium]|nr:Ig-like domain-containing protein [Lachnospiraceae bacterium]